MFANKSALNTPLQNPMVLESRTPRSREQPHCGGSGGAGGAPTWAGSSALFGKAYRGIWALLQVTGFRRETTASVHHPHERARTLLRKVETHGEGGGCGQEDGEARQQHQPHRHPPHAARGKEGERGEK